MKQHARIGARDYHTLKVLQEQGIPSYFSGCLTLTLDNPFTKRNNVIYAVDIDKRCLNYLQSHTNSKVIVVSHGVPLGIRTDNERRLQYAKKLLERYRRAKCVVTARLHAALPCLAIETPVLMIGKNNHRFHGLMELVRHCTEEELINGQANFDFDHPPENPKDYLPIRNNLIEIVTNWVASVKRGK